MNPSADLSMAELLRRRREAFAAFEAWEKAQRPVPPAPDVLAQLDAILALMPPRQEEVPDVSAYAGVRRMHECLSVLGAPR